MRSPSSEVVELNVTDKRGLRNRSQPGDIGHGLAVLIGLVL